MDREKAIVRGVIDAMDRLPLSYGDVAALSGLSIPTVRRIRSNGHVPKSERCWAGLLAFVERAKVARSRRDLGLPTFGGAQ